MNKWNEITKLNVQATCKHIASKKKIKRTKRKKEIRLLFANSIKWIVNAEQINSLASLFSQRKCSVQRTYEFSREQMIGPDPMAVRRNHVVICKMVHLQCDAACDGSVFVWR